MTTPTFRKILWASALFNIGGALAFAFPATLGQLMGLPMPVPAIYSALLVMFILLFGGTYAWIAVQPQINRPMVVLGAIGKICAFGVVFGFWLIGEAPVRGVLAASGDLFFASLFFRWLRATR